MTARASAAAADATARLRVAAQKERALVLAAVRAGEEVARAREREQAAARTAANRVQRALFAQAGAVVELADAVGDDRAAFVLGLAAKELAAYRKTIAATAAAPASTPSRTRGPDSQSPTRPRPHDRPE
ncbi:MAG: hypothetical protein ACRDV3_17515 [Acidothermaceae bacterium]